MKVWMGSDLSALDIMVVQIDGIHISEHLVLVAAIGIDGEGEKHPLGLIEGATEHSVTPRNMRAWCSLQRTTPCRPRSPPGHSRRLASGRAAGPMSAMLGLRPRPRRAANRRLVPQTAIA
jgi:hypothetical protein